jgi:S-adenosylmethionine uptake transporter
MATISPADKTMASPAIPFAVACLGIAFFSAMDGVMKGLTLDIGAYNALLWRTIIATLIMTVIAAIRGQRWPTKAAWTLHLWRGGIASIMAFTFFWGIARVPLAEGIALSFMAPIIALYLAGALLGETINRSTIIASILGFGGVIIIASGRIQGEFSQDALWGIGAILVSAVFYAGNIVLMRMQAKVAEPTEIALAQNVVVGAILLGFAPYYAVVPSVSHLPEITLAAVLTITSLLLLGWAYARAEAQHLIPVEYTAFVWAAIIGYLMFDEAVTLTTLAGTALIITGCIIAARTKSAKDAIAA